MIEVVLSCEHGGNQIPEQYQQLFFQAGDDLNSHKGWDIGILQIAEKVADSLSSKLYYSQISRLLVELNRSLHNRDLFSIYSRNLSDIEKKNILDNYYYPYRNQVESSIENYISTGKQVIHISFHSFTPVFNGKERLCEIGLLFDPERSEETKFAEKWKLALDHLAPHFISLFNYPYLGTDDGFTTYLRTKFSDKAYSGIELEVNQKYLLEKTDIKIFTKLISESLQTVISQYSR